MRRTLLTGCALCAFAFSQASLPTVQSVEKVALPAGVTVSMATISPDGTYAVVSPLSGVGLQRLDLDGGKLTEISQTGSPMDVRITDDGTNVVYRESTYDGSHRRFVSLKAYNNGDGVTTTLVGPSRSLEGFILDGAEAVVVENGRRSTKAMKYVNALEVGRVALSIHHGKLFVTAPNGKVSEIRPLGDQCGSYLWPALSPDGTRIVAFGVGTGAFTCDLNGNDVKLLGMYRAPQWVDNQTIVAMDDYDNGIVTVKSTIMALSADGKEKAALTNDDVVGVFPTYGAGKVAFTTPDGELYIINLK